MATAYAWIVTTLLDAVTASSTSAADDLSAAYQANVHMKITETDTRQVAGLMVVQGSTDGGTTYIDLATLIGPRAVGFTKLHFPVPPQYDHVRLKFTQGSGGKSASSTAIGISLKIN
jgi:hypothetical protein